MGKTTTAVNLAANLAQAGERVLLIDMDAQANASHGLGVRVKPGEPGILEVLLGETDIASIVRPAPVPGLEVAPSSPDMAGASVMLPSLGRREYRLRDALFGPDKPSERYSYIFIDCPPSLGLLTVNALVAAEKVHHPGAGRVLRAGGSHAAHGHHCGRPGAAEPLIEYRRTGVDHGRYSHHTGPASGGRSPLALSRSSVSRPWCPATSGLPKHLVMGFPCRYSIRTVPGRMPISILLWRLSNMARKTGLGRGLAALLGEGVDGEATMALDAPPRVTRRRRARRRL